MFQGSSCSSLALLCASLRLLASCSHCQKSRATAEAFFEKLVAPLSSTTFFEKHWGQGPVVLRGLGTGRNYSHLFSISDLEALVAPNSSSPNRLRPGEPLHYFTHLRIDLKSINFSKKATERLPKSGEPVDWQLVSRMRRMLDKGCTIVIGKAYSFWRPILEFINEFEQYLEVRVHGNIYITGAGFTGRPIHWDKTDAFYLQLSGQKAWLIWQPFVEDMLWKQDVEEFGAIATSQQERHTWMSTQKLLLNETLLPGDILYVPRGFLHEGTAPGDQNRNPLGGESVHLTVSPEVDSWAEFLEALPFTKIAGQPPPPGKAPFRSSGKSMPAANFEKAASCGGAPQSLRKHIPLRLSQHCRKKWFKKMALQKLQALDPESSLANIKKNVAAHDQQLVDAGYKADSIADLCLAYAALLRRDFISGEVDPVQDEPLDLDRPLCVQSPIAARVVPGWLSPPGFQSHAGETHVIHSCMNGPVRYAQHEKNLSMPFTVDSRFERPLRDVLHAEKNPEGVVWLRSLLRKVEHGDRDDLLEILRRMVSLNILQPQTGKRPRKEL